MAAQGGDPVRDGQVQAQLISKHNALVPGQTVTLGLRLQMDEHWHTYWKNPGDAGLATSIDWQFPPGYVAHEIEWPAPHYYQANGLATYGYEGEIVLPVRIEVPADAAVGEDVVIKATADWLMCKEICIPGSAALSLVLPVAATADDVEPEPRWAGLFAWADQRTPRNYDDAYVHVERQDGRRYRLTVRNAGTGIGVRDNLSVRFFPDNAGSIAMTAEQVVERSDTGVVSVSLPLDANQQWTDRLRGVLVYERGDDTRVYRVDAEVEPKTTEPKMTEN